MPKYCTAPNCKNDAKNSDRKSFYKFPLHDPARLKQWLKNMGREDWTPSRHQHLCHEHFTAACFTLRWGIRYLANNAVPTIFQLSENTEKRKGGEKSERNPKRQRNCGRKPVVTMAAIRVPPSDVKGQESQDRDVSTVQLYAIAVDTSQPGQSVLLDPSDIGHAMGSIQTAVPLAGKRKGGEKSERNPKRQRNCGRKPVVTMAAIRVPPSDVKGQESQDRDVSTVQLYAIAVDTSQPGQSVLLDPSDIGHAMGSIQTAVPLAGVDGHVASVEELPVTLFQTVEDLGEVSEGEQHPEVMLVSEGPTFDEEQVVEGVASAVLMEGQDVAANDPVPSSLTIENVALEMVEPSAAQDDRGIQIIAYFETIPNILPAVQPSPPSDTVLSSALSSKPIVSTLPIVSKHLPPSPGSLVLTLERLENVERHGEREAQEEESMEQQGKQLEEHRYHKNSLSKEQLEAIVIELQKKVKVLQQRHRRHLDKLLGLESTVSQLRHSNLLNEERLRLLEKAYVQTNAAVSDAGETVAIICEEENTAYLYALPKSDVEAEVD